MTHHNVSYTIQADSLDLSRYSCPQAEVLRPGKGAPSCLFMLSLKDSPHDAWSGLKAFFSSAQGTIEEALEYAVQRTNEAVAGKGAQSFGSCVTLAVDQDRFAAAAGGNGSAYLALNGKVIDVSPSPTALTREKFFGAFAAGAHGNGALVISFSQLSAQERTTLAQSFASPDQQQMSSGLFDGVIVAPREERRFGGKCASWRAKVRTLGRLAARPETYQKAFLQIIAHLRHPRAAFSLIRAYLARTCSHVRASLRAMPKKRRAYAIAGIIALLVVVRSFLMTLGARNIEEIIAETLKRESRISQFIEQKKEIQALALIDDTLALLALAPQHLSDTQAEALKNLQARLFQTAAQLNKVSLISSPTPVVSLERSFREARSFDLSGLALARGKLYTVNRAEKEVYELDGRERRIVVIKDFSQGAGEPVGIVSAVPGYVFVLTENPRGLLTLNTDTRAFTFSPLVLPRADALPITFAAYNQRIYMLDARTRAIYRYELTPRGFNLWSPWTDETSLDFSQATTFAIDGSIYVTFSDHDIVRLVQGKRQPFAIAAIRPPLEKVTAIATKEDSPFLYLLDPPQRRVVIIKKDDGSLVAQYTSPLFTDLRGLFPDEQAKRIYLLNGDTVYSVGPEDKSVIDDLQ